MNDEPLRRAVDGLADRLPRRELAALRAAQPPVRQETVETIIGIAQRGGPHHGLDELVEAYRTGTTTWSVLRQHPRIVAAMRERTEEVLAALSDRAGSPAAPSSRSASDPWGSGWSSAGRRAP